MKKLIVIGLVLSMLQIALVTSLTIPRHVDLAEITPERPSALELFALYKALVDYVSLEDCRGAASKLWELFRVYAPEDVRYVMARLNELMSEEVELLNQTSIYIKSAQRFLELGFVGESEAHVLEGFKTLTKANITHSELKAALIELSKLVPIRTSPILEGLEGTIKAYYGRLISLVEDIDALKQVGISKTELYISVTKEEVWTGSKIEVSGLLHSEGVGLQNRLVEIHIEDLRHTVITDARGSFKSSIQLPYIYKPEIHVYAVFTPKADDIKRFTASKSNVVKLKLLYIEPEIEAFLDKEEVKPLEEFVVYGRIRPMNLKMWMRAFGAYHSLAIGEDGWFKARLKVPRDVKEGAYTIELGSYAEGVIAPTAKGLKLKVYKLPIALDPLIPLIALAGLEAEISGRVFAEGAALVGSEVVVEAFGGRATTKVDDDGFFKAKLPIAHSLYTGSYELRISIVPKEPIYRGLEHRASIYVLNAYALTPLIALTAVLIKGLRVAKPKPPVAELERAAVRWEARPKRELKGMPLIYFKAVELVEGFTVIKMKSSHTVREYLSIVEPLLSKEAIKGFSELSFMLEEAVYGGLEPDIARAEALLSGLEDLLKWRLSR